MPRPRPPYPTRTTTRTTTKKTDWSMPAMTPHPWRAWPPACCHCCMPRPVRSHTPSPAAVSCRSTVVEERAVQTDQRAFSPSHRPGLRLAGQLVRDAGWAQPLCEVAPAVVALQEEPAWITGQRGQPAMPDVRHEQRDVACLGDEWHRPLAVPFEVVVLHPIERRMLARRVAASQDARRSRFHRTVPEIQVR